VFENLSGTYYNGEIINEKILVWKYKHGCPRYRWKDNERMGMKEFVSVRGMYSHDSGLDLRFLEMAEIFLFRTVGRWSPIWSTRHVGHWMTYCTWPGWLWWWRIWWNEDWQGKPKYSEKTCPSATLSTTNLTWPDPDLNPGRRGGKPGTNRLNYGAAYGGELLEQLNAYQILKNGHLSCS
jgi:hypothetical protein